MFAKRFSWEIFFFGLFILFIAAFTYHKNSDYGHANVSSGTYNFSGYSIVDPYEVKIVFDDGDRAIERIIIYENSKKSKKQIVLPRALPHKYKARLHALEPKLYEWREKLMHKYEKEIKKYEEEVKKMEELKEKKKKLVPPAKPSDPVKPSDAVVQSGKVKTKISVTPDIKVNIDDVNMEIKQEIEKAHGAYASSINALKDAFKSMNFNFTFDYDNKDDALIIRRDGDVHYSASSGYTVKPSVGGEKWNSHSPDKIVFTEPIGNNITSLILKLPFGHISVETSDEDEGEVKIIVKSSNGRDISDIKSKLPVQILTKKGSLKISIEKKSYHDIYKKITLDAKVSMPSWVAPATFQTQGGHISAEDLVAKGRSNESYDYLFHTQGGHISLDNIMGVVDAKTQGGHIDCDGLEGKYNLVTKGGHVGIDGLWGGKVNILTHGGHIKLEDIEGSVVGKTNGGNIYVDVLELQGDLDMKTNAGNIAVVLPSDVKASLSAIGTSVRLSPAFHFDGEKLKSNFSGMLNSGKKGKSDVIRLSTNVGNISIDSDN